jgi:gentisate 1,2-dioxygenase
VQVLLPGEVARAHRHSPAAIRFIIEGRGAYTAVEGEKVIMQPGDFVLTPSWQWHDHGNETQETVVWMDGLDVPLTKSLNAMFFEMHKDQKASHGKPVNGSQALYGHGKLTPTWTKERPRFSPLMLYSWEQTQEALHDLRNHDASPYDGICLEYTHAQTGGPVLPTMSCRVQMIRKGDQTKAKRVTGSSVFHVVQGKGRSTIEGKTFDWEKGDIIALPSWAQHDYAATGGEDAILFSISDRPVLDALGFYREELS